MNPSIQFKTTTLPFLIAFALACFGLSPTGRAVVPAPDGGYPGFNTAEGEDALFSLTTGIGNTANGASALFSNTTGGGNTANGIAALINNTRGFDNTANGAFALQGNTSGSDNTATGVSALFSNTTGIDNTANGISALQSNTTGFENTANGVEALFSNKIGSENTATGYQALFSNRAFQNTANGSLALLNNTTGGSNTATGHDALRSNTTGHSNTADGRSALQSNKTGNNNTANGLNALFSNKTGSNNIALGLEAGGKLTTGSNNIDIGNEGVAAEANTIRVGTVGTQGATFIAGISGKTASGGVAVYVNANGKLGTTVSSSRFKDQIKPMDKASEAIHALKPVTFRYKQELDPEGIPQFGLVAEDVEKVNPDLVARDDQGKVYTVRYEAVNAMLLNEFLKEHKAVQEQGAMIARQQKQIEALTAGLQKVSAQIEISRPAPQMAANNQ
jgi:hypothetical protein